LEEILAPEMGIQVRLVGKRYLEETIATECWEMNSNRMLGNE
jgi:hypothetical protein